MNHDILLTRLATTFVINGFALEWLHSYLTDRSQSVVLNGSMSKSVHLTFSVPQGSVLGPLLFVLYTKDVTGIIESHGLFGHCYADGTQIYFHCKPDEVTKLSDAFSVCR